MIVFIYLFAIYGIFNVVWNLLSDDIEPSYDKQTAITMRLMEQKYLSESDKVSVIAELINDLDTDKIEEWQKNALKNKVLEKFK